MGSNPISRSIFLLLLAVFPLFSQTHILKNDYFLKTDQILASDLAAVAPQKDFVIDRFGSRSAVQFPLARLQRLFEAQGIAVDSQAAVITVYRVGELDLEALKAALKGRFEAHYPQMHVAEVRVKPQSFIDISGMELIEVDVAENTLRRNQGTFQAWFGKNGQGLKRLFFAYEITASLEVFTATRQINGGGIVGPENVEKRLIAFESLYNRPVLPQALGRVVAKGRIARGDVIYENRVARVPDVRRNGRIRVELVESGIRLTFLATVQKDAQIGESVEVEDAQGRSFRVRIISKELARVE